MGDGNIAGEIPLLSSFLYLLSWAERVRLCFDLVVTEFYSQSIGVVVRPSRSIPNILPGDQIRGHCQAGSLIEAVHLSKKDAGVLRPAKRGQKPRVKQKGKRWLGIDVQYA